jgi:Cu/Ag efflux protein CusF
MKILLSAILIALTAAGAQSAIMLHGGHDHTPAGVVLTAQKQPAIEATGSVNAVNAGKRTVNITHAPIRALGWPAMTMDFTVAKGVDLAILKRGSEVVFTLSRGADGIYKIDRISTR